MHFESNLINACTRDFWEPAAAKIIVQVTYGLENMWRPEAGSPGLDATFAHNPAAFWQWGGERESKGQQKPSYESLPKMLDGGDVDDMCKGGKRKRRKNNNAVDSKWAGREVRWGKRQGWWQKLAFDPSARRRLGSRDHVDRKGVEKFPVFRLRSRDADGEAAVTLPVVVHFQSSPATTLKRMGERVASGH